MSDLGLIELLALPLGLALAWLFVVYARRFGRHRLAVLASGLVVAALIYVGAALVGGAGLSTTLTELAGTALFGVFALLGLRRASAWLAIGWGLHVVWDLAAQLADAPVLPLWYAIACLSFDVFVAVEVARRGPDSPASRAQ